MTDITTAQLKNLMDDLDEHLDPNEIEDLDAIDDDLKEIVKKYDFVKRVLYGSILLTDDSVISVVDMGDGSEYGWFWSQPGGK